MSVTKTWSALGVVPPERSVLITMRTPVAMRRVFLPYLIHARVREVDERRWIGTTVERKWVVSRAACEEGISWIRGHHSEESEEGAALIALQVLSQ